MTNAIDVNAIINLADEALSTFSTKECRVFSDASWGSWIKEMIMQSHGDMMPDDYRYEYVHDALDLISNLDRQENNDIDIIRDILTNGIYTDIYTTDLLKWLSSNLSRPDYVDEAINDLGKAQCITEDIASGQWLEKVEVLSLVLDFLIDRVRGE